jgi:hypothetical protein
MSAHDAMMRAAAALCRAQHADGHWEDYRDLPVGSADAWVTAYVGLALCDHAEATDDAAARDAARRAAAWLIASRGAEPGWGYNSRTGADADSTAHALLLLRRFDVRCLDVATWLRDAWQPDGGFSTYRRRDGWGIAHPCVTPVAYLALEPPDQRALRSAFLRYVEAGRAAGGWRSYWWASPHYSTLVNLIALDALAELGVGAEPIEPHGAPDESAFDLACRAGIAALQRGSSRARDLAAALASAQRDDGTWPPGAALRVTEPSCLAPWIEPAGRVYLDAAGTFTTATALRSLALGAR